MAAACDQAQERRLHRIGLEVVRGDVAVQVVDRRERQPGARRQAPWRSRRRPAARRSGPACWWRRPVGVAAASVPACCERVVDDRVDELQVVAGGDLRHDAAVALVEPSWEEMTLLRISPSGVTTAAHVSSQDVSIARITAAAALGTSSSVPPSRVRHMIECVFVVVVVVAAPDAGGVKAEATRTARSPRRSRRAPRACSDRGRRRPRTGGRSTRSRCPRRRASGHGEVHQVPHRVVARADQIPDQLRRRRSAADADAATAWTARARTSPATTARGRTGARSRHIGQVGVAEAADLHADARLPLVRS